MKIAKCKWEHISIDFVSGLLKTRKGFDSIWVIMDELTKFTIGIRKKVVEREAPLFLVPLFVAPALTSPALVRAQMIMVGIGLGR